MISGWSALQIIHQTRVSTQWAKTISPVPSIRSLWCHTALLGLPQHHEATIAKKPDLCWRQTNGQTNRQTAATLKALFQHMGGLLTIRFCLSETSRNCPLLNCKMVTAINMPIVMTLLVTIVRFNFQVVHFLYYTIDDTAVCTCRMSLLYLTQQSQMLQSITANKVKMLRVYTACDTRHWCLATTNRLPES